VLELEKVFSFVLALQVDSSSRYERKRRPRNFNQRVANATVFIDKPISNLDTNLSDFRMFCAGKFDSGKNRELVWCKRILTHSAIDSLILRWLLSHQGQAHFPSLRRRLFFH